MTSTLSKRVALVLAAVLTARSVASAGDAVPPRSASWIIVPGESIGPARLGMSPDEVSAALGKPDIITEGKWWKYDRDGLSVVFDLDKPVVDLLVAGGGRFPGEKAAKSLAHTGSGVGPGSSGQQVATALGPPDRRERDSLGAIHLQYRSIGLRITLFEDRVIRMDVESPRCDLPPKGASE
jgi:hypothetical protein